MEKLIDDYNNDNATPIDHCEVGWPGCGRCQEICNIVNKIREVNWYGLTIEGVEIDLGVIMCCICNEEFLLWLIYVNAEALKIWKRPIFIMRYGDASNENFKYKKPPLILYSACIAGPTVTLGSYYVHIMIMTSYSYASKTNRNISSYIP
jgi:hypothetical protein